MQENGSITPDEVKEKLRHNDSGFVLVDVRDEDEYKDWNIKGSINVPINSYIARGNIDEIVKSLSQLPKDKEIITVCARGVNSQVAAAILRVLNYRAIHMNKGMKGWNENYDVYKIDLDSAAIVSQFIRIGKGCLSYIVCDTATKETAVFDPSIFIAEYLDFINHNNLKAKYVIDTHSHADHFSGAMALAKALNMDYFVNKIDIDNGFEYKSLEGVKNLKLGKTNIEVLPTPGHTDGSLSFLIDDKALICGDLLLMESVGRPDLARSPEDTEKGAGNVFDTLNNVVFKLTNSVKVLPAHFVSTLLRPVTLSLSELKQQNKSLTIPNRNEFITYITGSMPKTPPNYESIKRYNKKGVIVPLDYAEELEIGPNRCAARN